MRSRMSLVGTHRLFSKFCLNLYVDVYWRQWTFGFNFGLPFVHFGLYLGPVSLELNVILKGEESGS